MHKRLRSRAARFLQKLWTFVREDVWILAGAAALQAVSTLLGVAAPNLLGALASKMSGSVSGSGSKAGGAASGAPGRGSWLGWLTGSSSKGQASSSQHGIATIAIVLAAQFALRLGASLLASIGAERVCGRMRAALFDSLMRQDVSYHDASKAGDLLQMLDADVREVRRSVREVVGDGVGTASALVGGLASLLLISPALTGGMVAVSLPAVVAGNAFFYFLRSRSREYSDASAAASAVAAESLANVRLVKSYTGEEAALAKFEGKHDEAGRLAVGLGAYAGVFHACLSLGMSGVIGGVLWGGSQLVQAGQLTQGDLAAFVAQAVGLQRSLMSGSALAAKLSRAGGTVSRVLDQLDLEPVANRPGGLRWDGLARGGRTAQWSGLPKDEPPAGSDDWCMKGELELHDVRFSYPSRPGQTVLDGLNLRIGAGEVVALVGESGAGKSTITALLQRFYAPESGRVTVDGRDLREADAGWIRRQIAVVPQEPVLWSGTVRDNIRYGRPGASDEEIEQAARDACCDFAFRLPQGLDTELGERGALLSGGQRQRLAIARAILRKPRLLLLDEPAAAQDAHNAAMVRAALRRAMRNTTTVIIAHRLSSVRHADRIVVLAGGKAVEEGKHDELLAKDGRYTSMVQKQLS